MAIVAGAPLSGKWLWACTERGVFLLSLRSQTQHLLPPFWEPNQKLYYLPYQAPVAYLASAETPGDKKRLYLRWVKFDPTGPIGNKRNELNQAISAATVIKLVAGA